MVSSHFVIVLLAAIIGGSFGWQEDVTPNRYTILGSNDVARFRSDHLHDSFKVLEVNADRILVGSRNAVYNLSLYDMVEDTQQRFEWNPRLSDTEMCLVKGKSQDDCQNYIRLLGRFNDTDMIVCGTNAYNPLCRRYKLKGEQYEVVEEFTGKAQVPYDPNHNSTAIFTEGNVYAGTVTDFSGVDPVIYRHPLRSEQYDVNHLYAPNFVGSLSYGNHVYFFFRETAVESSERTIYSRVARVCKSDKGGPRRWSKSWTSFQKSRLTCSMPGEFPFHFNEIQSISDVVEGVYGNQTENLVYGLFTTPENSIYGAAVCAFRMQDIAASFDGAFKVQAKPDAKWLPMNANKHLPQPRPGQCVKDSRVLPEATLNFISSHPLMDTAVPAFYGLPILTHVSQRYKITQIAVDPQVRAANGKAYDILFIGTDKGRILRVINSESNESRDKAKPVVIEEIQVPGIQTPIKHLYIARDAKEKSKQRVIFITDNEISSIPLYKCYSDEIKTSSECVGLQDPYCAWDSSKSQCVSVASVDPTENRLLMQNLSGDFSNLYPKNKGISNEAHPSLSRFFSVNTLWITVLVLGLYALTAVLISSLVILRRRRPVRKHIIDFSSIGSSHVYSNI